MDCWKDKMEGEEGKKLVERGKARGVTGSGRKVIVEKR